VLRDWQPPIHKRQGSAIFEARRSVVLGTHKQWRKQRETRARAAEHDGCRVGERLVHRLGSSGQQGGARGQHRQRQHPEKVRVCSGWTRDQDVK
jgi:hypothetical protein